MIGLEGVNTQVLLYSISMFHSFIHFTDSPYVMPLQLLCYVAKSNKPVLHLC